MKDSQSKEFVVLLHNIRSLHNVGSIFRTADAAGVGKIYLCGITPAPLDRFGQPEPKLTKVSLGAEKYIQWEKTRSMVKVIKTLKKEGFAVLAVEQSPKSMPYYKYAPLDHAPSGVLGTSRGKNEGKLALVLGNEVKGLPSVILKRCDKILEIPMRGAMVRQAHHPRQTRLGKESLNVSVAFGIVAFELAKHKV